MGWLKKLFGGKEEAPPETHVSAGAGDSGAAMAETLARLGIPLDMGLSTTEQAFFGGVVKANIFRAVQSLQAGELAAALRTLDSTLGLLDGKPVDPKVVGVGHFLRARARVQLGDREGAATDLEQARRLYPGNPLIEDAYAAFTGGPPRFYAPSLEGAVEVRQVAVTDALVGILRRHPAPEQQTSSVKYLYTFAVHPQQGGDAVLYVASEVNKMPPDQRAGSHFLGVFPGQGHVNLGASDEWADLEAFAQRALAVAQERLAQG